MAVEDRAVRGPHGNGVADADQLGYAAASIILAGLLWGLYRRDDAAPAPPA